MYIQDPDQAANPTKLQEIALQLHYSFCTKNQYLLPTKYMCYEHVNNKMPKTIVYIQYT